MELEMVQGCICDCLLIDGEDERYITDEKRREVIGRLSKAWKPEDLNYLLQLYLELHSDSRDVSDKPCECCGDIIVTYKAKI